ncbi:hypothetical protein P7C71_g265, partial [Lecanoromycetidae sp. Uapishka_2]
MGKTKRKHPDIEEILARPWCYYCERDFDDLKILINHQKAKHFKCERCGRRLNTAGGLSVHMTQVHKETLTVIENALPNRSGLDVEIFGMEGIPDEVVQSHNQRVLQQFAQAEADRRAATGNAGPGAAGAGGPKKPKLESATDLKKRLAEHKAKKTAEEAAGISSGGNTPSGLGEGQSPGMGQSPSTFAGSPAYPPQQQQFGAPPNNSTYSSYPQPYGQQPPPFQPQQSPFSPQQQAFSPPGQTQFQNNQGFGPPQQFQQPGGPFPNGPPQFQPGLPQFQQGPPQFQNGPPQFQNGPPAFQGGPPQFQNGPPQFQNGPPPQFQNSPPAFLQGPPQYGAGSPPPFQQNQFQPPRNQTPPHHNGMPQRPGSLPPAPGLPQRPSFGAPPVNAFQMQQMHQGQMGGPPNPSDHPFNAQQQVQSAGPQNGKAPVPNPLLEPPTVLSANASSLDDLVSGAAKDADNAAEVKTEVSKAEASKPEEKKAKKDKDKNMKLVYSDNDVSPEEKMAQMPRYAFAP